MPLLVLDPHTEAELIAERRRLRGTRLRSAGKSTAATGKLLTSAVLPATFRLVRARPRPTLLVAATTDDRVWSM